MKKLSTFLQLFLALGLIFLFLFWVAYDQTYNWETVWEYKYVFLKGWFITICISLASLLLSLFFGLFAALLKRSRLPVFSDIAKIYIELIRGTPLLVQILFFFYVISYNLGLENRYVSGIIILSLFHGAYIAEMIRGSLNAISSSQLESAKAIGLTKWQSYRFIIFPQAVRHIIPSLAGEFASIIKDSSLLSIIGISELTNSAQQINSVTYSTLETYLPLGIAYLALTLPISLFSKTLERKFRYET